MSGVKGISCLESRIPSKYCLILGSTLDGGRRIADIKDHFSDCDFLGNPESFVPGVCINQHGGIIGTLRTRSKFLTRILYFIESEA